jgi:hypothetical protein
MWFRDNGENLIPRNSEFADLYSASKFTLNLGEMPNLEEEFFVPGCCIPLIAAILEELKPEFLAQMVEHHGMGEHLGTLANTFAESWDTATLRSGQKILASDVFMECFRAIESTDESHLQRAFEASDDEDITMTIALLSAKSSKHWPVSILARHEDLAAAGSKPVTPLAVGKYNFLDLIDVDKYPKDSSGIRYDWLLERSGMLLPAVIKKSLQAFTLWESLAWIGSNSRNNSVKKGFADYCIHHAPVSQRALIRQGFLTMVLEASHIADGGALLRWMRGKFENTFLADIPNSIILQTNMVRGIEADRVIEDAPDQFTHLVSDKEMMFQKLCDEVSCVPSDQMGLSHFLAIGFLDRRDFTAPAQILRADFDREGLICQLLAGLRAFSPLGRERNEWVADGFDCLEDNVSALVKRFSSYGEMEYSRFKSLRPEDAEIIAKGGLDIKRLPKLSRSGKARLLEHDLGM